MDEKEEGRNCGDCKFFVWYYFKFNERFKKSNCGVCVNLEKGATAAKKRIGKDCACGLWQPYEIQVRERRESIKSKLQRIAGQLEDISLVLKDDE